MATLWQRAHASGLCPPSLLRTEGEIVDADGFGEDVLKLLAGQGTIVGAVFRVFSYVHYQPPWN